MCTVHIHDSVSAHKHVYKGVHAHAQPERAINAMEVECVANGRIIYCRNDLL